MKVIDKIEIEYVIPETDSEQKEIEEIIKNTSQEQTGKINIADFNIVDNTKKTRKGYWRKVNK
ncbi:MAG: hypothetical protein OEZ22_13620 [Spirochaetia bacterium]|nr:hypothetical protein [Spirochaetia bacterium]